MVSIPSLGFIFRGEIFDGPPVPSYRIQSAKESLELAADAGAITYSEQDYRLAEKLIQQGWIEVGHQNGRIPLLRSFKRADSIFSAAKSAAERSLRATEDSLASLQSRGQNECRELEAELKNWRNALDESFIFYTAERYWSDAEIKSKQARDLIKVKEYQAAHDAVILAHKALERLAGVLTAGAEEEAAGMNMWRTWVDNAVANSRNSGGHLIVVDKADHQTYVLRGGKIVKTYDCELGYNSSRPKLFAGDGATPEGCYKIVKVKPGNSKYYKALLIDYPNDADKRRFADNKRKGAISRGAGIGKLIEIHGDGGRNKDWTDGCVALANRDMDDILRYASVGTPVVIVRRYDGW